MDGTSSLAADNIPADRPGAQGRDAELEEPLAGGALARPSIICIAKNRQYLAVHAPARKGSLRSK